jgi:hypothetical protein
MATFFKNKVLSNIGTTDTQVISVAPTSKVTIVGLSLTNLTDAIVLANLMVTDASNVTGYYAKNLIIPPNSSARVVNGGEKLMLPANNILEVSSDTVDGLDAVVSYIEIV